MLLSFNNNFLVLYQRVAINIISCHVGSRILKILLVSHSVKATSGCNGLKSDSHLPKKFALFSSMKALKNTFYFIWKALFFLKIFKFLSWFFGHVEKTAWLEIMTFNLVNKQLQYSSCPLSQEVKTIRQWTMVS